MPFGIPPPTGLRIALTKRSNTPSPDLHVLAKKIGVTTPPTIGKLGWVTAKLTLMVTKTLHTPTYWVCKDFVTVDVNSSAKPVIYCRAGSLCPAIPCPVRQRAGTETQGMP